MLQESWINQVASTDLVANMRVGAFLLYKNKLVSKGFNSYKTHPKQWEYRGDRDAACLHAEVDCIIRAINKGYGDRLNKCSLFVVRVKKDGSLGLAKPCKGCTKIINDYQIKQVIWSK